MKTITKQSVLTYCLFILVSGTCLAQAGDDLQKGRQLAGLSLNSSYAGHYGFIGNVGARYGYFLFERFAVGPEVNFGFNGTLYKDFRPGIFARYYLNGNKVAPFVEGAYYHSFGWERTENLTPWNPVNANEGRVGLGLRFDNIIKKKFSFETVAGYSTLRNAFWEFRFVYHF